MHFPVVSQTGRPVKNDLMESKIFSKCAVKDRPGFCAACEQEQAGGAAVLNFEGIGKSAGLFEELQRQLRPSGGQMCNGGAGPVSRLIGRQFGSAQKVRSRIVRLVLLEVPLCEGAVQIFSVVI